MVRTEQMKPDIFFFGLLTGSQALSKSYALEKFEWHKIADDEKEIAFQPNELATIEVKGKKMGLARHQEQLSAFALKCPHAGGLLTDGWIDLKGDIVCPLHRYRFSLQNGRNTSGEGYYLKRWPVEKRPEGIFVGVEKGGMFPWLSV